MCLNVVSFLSLPRSLPTRAGMPTPSMTPNPHGSLWRNAAPDLDQDVIARAQEVGLDLYAANDDPLLALGLAPRDWDDDEDDMLGRSSEDEVGSDPESSSAAALTVPRLKAQLQSQAALIAQLEDRNMTLDERVFVLERELKELKAALAARRRARTGPGQDDEEEEAASASPAAGGSDTDEGAGAGAATLMEEEGAHQVEQQEQPQQQAGLSGSGSDLRERRDGAGGEGGDDDTGAEQRRRGGPA